MNVQNNNTFPGFSSPAACFGIRRGWNVSDLDSYTSASKTAVFTNITTAQVSSALPAARYVDVFVTLASANTTCNIDLYTTANSVDTLVASQPICYDTQEVHFGNYEGVDLGGSEFKIGVSSIVNASDITISYRING